MKGVVFTEFLEMIESRYSLEVLDEVVRSAALPSGGGYTSIGTYPPQEMQSLVTQLSRVTGKPAAELLNEFGRHLLQRFTQMFPQFFLSSQSAFGFLERVEDFIHLEVKKLYPDAELPSFECQRRGDSELTMLYRSPRGLSDLAEGLMRGCIEHFGEQIDIHKQDLAGGTGKAVRFTLTRRAT